MAGAEDYLAILSPTDEDKRDAMNRALMMAAAQAFAANDGRPFQSILGQTMFAGLKGYDDSVSQNRKERADKFAARRSANELAEADRKTADQRAMSDAMRDAYSAPAGAAPYAPGTRQSAAFTPEVNAGLPPPPQSSGMSGGAKDEERRVLKNTIDRLVASGNGHLAPPLQDRLAKLEPAIKEVRAATQNGKRVTVKVYQDGTEQVSQFDPDLEKLHFADNGQQAGIGLNPYTGAVQSPGVQKQMTPGEVDSSQRGWAGVNLQRDQAQRESLSQPFEVTQGGRQILVQQDKRSGQLFDVNTKQPVGDVSPKQDAATTSDLKDIRKVSTTLETLIKTYKPEYVGAKGAAGELADQYGSQIPVIGAGMGDPNRVQFRQLASSVVNDYIKAVTGATVGQSGEQQRLMRAVPSPSDSDVVYLAKLRQMKENMDRLPGIVSNTAPQQPPQVATPPAAEPTATGPNNMKIVFRNGKWQPL